MKLGTITKLYKKYTITPKKVVDDVMSASYDIIVLFPIYG